MDSSHPISHIEPLISSFPVVEAHPIGINGSRSSGSCDETLVRFHGWNEHPFSYNDFEAVSCESTPKGVQTQRGRVFWKQNPHTARLKRDGGRWGVVPASQHQEILVALASLIRAQRTDLAMVLIEQELNSQT